MSSADWVAALVCCMHISYLDTVHEGSVASTTTLLN